MTAVSLILGLWLTPMSVIDRISASPEERFEMFAREAMGPNGCPDKVAAASDSHIVASVSPRVVHRPDGSDRIVVDVTFTNAGVHPEGINKRYVTSNPRRNRTAHLWLYDAVADKWLEYSGPHGRMAPSVSDDYRLLGPGKSVSAHDVDITDSYKFPGRLNGLWVKVLFRSEWNVHAKNAFVESNCSHLETVNAP